MAESAIGVEIPSLGEAPDQLGACPSNRGFCWPEPNVLTGKPYEPWNFNLGASKLPIRTGQVRSPES
jgi:hypothetical protein